MGMQTPALGGPALGLHEQASWPITCDWQAGVPATHVAGLLVLLVDGALAGRLIRAARSPHCLKETGNLTSYVTSPMLVINSQC